MLVESFDNVDYSGFSVGQRVVRITYTWKRKATEDDKVWASLRGSKCPDEINDFDYVTYDEAEYDQRMQQTEAQLPKMK